MLSRCCRGHFCTRCCALRSYRPTRRTAVGLRVAHHLAEHPALRLRALFERFGSADTVGTPPELLITPEASITGGSRGRRRARVDQASGGGHQGLGAGPQVPSRAAAVYRRGREAPALPPARTSGPIGACCWARLKP